jgi:hypothetical protein
MYGGKYRKLLSRESGALDWWQAETTHYAAVRPTWLAYISLGDTLALSKKVVAPSRKQLPTSWAFIPTFARMEIWNMDSPVGLLELPDLSEWERRSSTQIIPEKSAIASPYVGGSDQNPRDIRTLRRWRESRRGPSFLKIGGRYFYTIGALRDFYQRSIRGGVG